MELEEELLVTGDKVHLVKREVVKSVPLSDLVMHVRDMWSDRLEMSPLFPAKDGTVKMYARKGNAVGMLMQINPCVLAMKYDNRRSVNVFNVSIPWTWALCVFKSSAKQLEEAFNDYVWSSVYLCTTKSVLTSVSDKVFVSPYLNQFGEGAGRMCTGNILETGMKLSLPIMCQRFITAFKDSTFNDDLMPRFPSNIWTTSMSPERRNFSDCLKKWEKKTMDNPMYALTDDFNMVPYPVMRGDLQSFIKFNLGGYND